MKLTSLGALLALLSLIPAVHAQDATPSPSPSATPEEHQPAGPGKHQHGGPGGREGHGMMGLANQLNLTADQQNQLKPVFEEMHSKVKAIRDDSSLSQEQKHAKIREIRQANRAKIEAVLTPEQKQKFANLRGRHGKGGPGKGEGDE